VLVHDLRFHKAINKTGYLQAPSPS